MANTEDYNAKPEAIKAVPFEQVLSLFRQIRV